MKDLLLCGMPQAGKTRIASVLSNFVYVEPYQQTSCDEHTIPLSGDILKAIPDAFGSWEYQDLGGTKLYDANAYGQYIRESRNVVFVFNGFDFLNELKNYKEGGAISTMLTFYVLSQYKNLIKTDNLIFVATHADLYQGDLKKEILSCLKTANKEYREFMGENIDRYVYADLFNMRDRFYCIDARDKEQVKDTFKRIITYAYAKGFNRGNIDLYKTTETKNVD